MGLRLGAVLVGSDAALAWASAGAGGDVILHPQPLQARSPDGRYEVEIRRPAQASPHAAVSTATLFVRSDGGRALVWQQALPHRPQPRFVLVGDAGQVLLLDEALNVRSERAVTVISLAGTALAQHTFDAVCVALGLPAAALSPLARYGPWMQSVPRLSARGDTCEVQAGGRTLVIRLSDGVLSAR